VIVLKKWVLSVLMLSMVTLVSACGNTGGTGSSKTTEATSTPVASAATTAPAASPSPSQNEPIYVVEGIRDMANAYYANWIKGGKNYAKSIGIPDDHFIVIQNQGSSQKQLADIKAIVAKTKGNVVFNLDPNEAADVPAIAKYLGEQNVPFVTWWNKPDDSSPSQYPSWVMHITFDNYTSGSKMAEELMKNLKEPYKGKIIAVQGLLGNTAAIERYNGFKDTVAKYPDVKIVSSQPADWDENKAFSVVSTQLVSTPDLSGIWCANDQMAMGAIQALKAKNLNGKIPVVGTDGTSQMFEAIQKGDATATVVSDSYLQGGLGLAIAVAVKQGKLKLTDLTEDKRSWMAVAPVITKANAKEMNDQFYVNEPKYDWTNFFDKYQGPIKKK
jgi:ribose transport system substrate-binding protein